MSVNESCEYVTKQISGMKTHIKDSNEKCGVTTIFHIKIDRNDEKQIVKNINKMNFLRQIN